MDYDAKIDETYTVEWTYLPDLLSEKTLHVYNTQLETTT